MSVKRASRTQGEIKHWRQAGNGDLLEGDVGVNDSITVSCVGVDISIYALLTEERSSYSPVLIVYCIRIR